MKTKVAKVIVKGLGSDEHTGVLFLMATDDFRFRVSYEQVTTGKMSKDKAVRYGRSVKVFVGDDGVTYHVFSDSSVKRADAK